jgi:hypothetical protein
MAHAVRSHLHASLRNLTYTGGSEEPHRGFRTEIVFPVVLPAEHAGDHEHRGRKPECL